MTRTTYKTHVQALKISWINMSPLGQFSYHHSRHRSAVTHETTELNPSLYEIIEYHECMVTNISIIQLKSCTDPYVLRNILYKTQKRCHHRPRDSKKMISVVHHQSNGSISHIKLPMRFNIAVTLHRQTIIAIWQAGGFYSLRGRGKTCIFITCHKWTRRILPT